MSSDLLHDSVLGLIHFLLYIYDIKSVIQNAYYYADDTILKGASDPDSQGKPPNAGSRKCGIYTANAV